MAWSAPMRGTIAWLSMLAMTAGAAPPGDVGERRWSVGAGAQFRGGSIAALRGVESTVPSVAVERWFGRTASVDLAMSGQASVLLSRTGDVQLGSFQGMAVALTGRFVVTEHGAPIAASLFAALSLSAGTQTELLTPSVLTRQTNVYSVALTCGVGLECWLDPRASLRLLVGLVRGEATQRGAGPPTFSPSAASAPFAYGGRFDLLPDLELRWYF